MWINLAHQPAWDILHAGCRFSHQNYSHGDVQYIPRNMHTVFALLCFVVVIHWLIIPYPSGLLHWHCGNLTIAPVPAKQPWWIWINTSCEFTMNDYITTTKQSKTKPCAYFLGYTVWYSDLLCVAGVWLLPHQGMKSTGNKSQQTQLWNHVHFVYVYIQTCIWVHTYDRFRKVTITAELMFLKVLQSNVIGICI